MGHAWCGSSPRPRSTPKGRPPCGPISWRCSVRRGEGRSAGNPTSAFELTAADAGLAISLWVPGVVPPGLVERAVEAAWPGARTETLPATPLLAGGGIATGGELRLALPEQYPLRTEHKVDSLRPLLGALDGMGEGESAAVQVLARPVTGRRLTRLHKAAAARRAGRPATRTARLVDLVTPGPTAQARQHRPEPGKRCGRHLGQGRPTVLGHLHPLRRRHHRHRQPGAGAAAGSSPRRRVGVLALRRPEPSRPPPPAPSRPGPRRAPLRPRRPRLGRRARRAGPPAHRPERARPHPGRGQGRRPAASRRPATCPDAGRHHTRYQVAHPQDARRCPGRRAPARRPGRPRRPLPPPRHGRYGLRQVDAAHQPRPLRRRRRARGGGDRPQGRPHHRPLRPAPRRRGVPHRAHRPRGPRRRRRY